MAERLDTEDGGSENDSRVGVGGEELHHTIHLRYLGMDMVNIQDFFYKSFKVAE